MKKFELILSSFALLGLILKLFHIVGGGIFVVFSMTTLSVLFFPFGLLLFNNISLSKSFRNESYIGISPLRIIATIANGIALSYLSLGLLFKIQHYAGANLLLIVGLFATLIVSVFYFIQNKKLNIEYKSIQYLRNII